MLQSYNKKNKEEIKRKFLNYVLVNQEEWIIFAA